MLGIGAEIAINFIISYIAGNLPAIKSEGDLQERVDKAYQRALKRWSKNSSVRESLSSRYFAYIDNLKDYIITPEAVNVDSLVKLWAEELRSDPICYDFILEHKIDDLRGKSESVDKLLRVIDAKQDLIFGAVMSQNIGFQRGLKVHKPVDGYIRRYCATSRDNNDFIYYFHPETKRFTLADYLIGAKSECLNKFILYSGAQTGKTTELRNLCWELQQSELYYPISFEVRTSADLKQEQLPYNRFIDNKEVVVVIDALDEINGKGRDELLMAINSYAHDNPDMKMVLSCRSNYRRDDNMDLFQELFLLDLSDTDIQLHIDNQVGKGNGLWMKICRAELSDFAKYPFYLNILIDSYNKERTLPKNRSELYEMFIRQSFDDRCTQGSMLDDNGYSFDDIVLTLQRVALAMSLMNRQSLSKSEYERCLNNDSGVILLCKRSGIIQIEDKQYSFIHNAFREWLAAKHLYDKGIEEAKRLAAYPNGRVKQDWYNIIILWIAMYNNEEKQYVAEIVEWLKESSIELLLYAESDTLDDASKFNIFKGILVEYKSLGIRLGTVFSDVYKNLIKFGQPKFTAGFIADELDESKIGSIYYANLTCLCLFLDWSRLEIQSSEVYNKLLNVLEKKVKFAITKNFYNDWTYIYLENSFFGTGPFVRKYFELLKGSKNPNVIKTMLSLIDRAGKADNYIDYILEKEQYVRDQNENGVTHVITRDEVFETLSKLCSHDGIAKLLKHKFSYDHVYYSSEHEHYYRMMSNCLKKAAEYIKEGHNELIGLVEDSFLMHFSKYHYHLSRNADSQKLFDEFRAMYLEAGLSVIAKKEFDDEARQLLINSTERKRLDYLYAKMGLWITMEMLDTYYVDLNPDNPIDQCFASWFTECSYPEIEKAARIKNKALFPEPKWLQLSRERKKKSWQSLADYDTFKQSILETVGRLPDTSRKRWRLQRTISDEVDKLDDYAFKFVSPFVDGEDIFKVEDIIKAIKDKDYYDSFFMQVVSDALLNREPDEFLLEDYKIRCFDFAKRVVEKYAQDPSPSFFLRNALRLLLSGYFTVSNETLLALLPVSHVYISKNDESNFCKSYSLFDYTIERISVSALGEAIVNLLKNDAVWTHYNECRSFVSYIIDNCIDEGYDVLLNQVIKKGEDLLFIAENMIKSGIHIEQIKYETDTMKMADRLTIYSSLRHYQNEGPWIKEKLEPEFENLSGYPLYQSLSILLGLGSLKALQHIASNPELLNSTHYFNFCYNDPNAITNLMWILKYTHSQVDDYHTTVNSVLNSLGQIAVLDESYLNEIKVEMYKLMAVDENFKYLNRYIISFENQYYSLQAPTTDINQVIELMDSVPTISDKLINETVDEVEPVYISYNWESKSETVVDYLCYVLDAKRIPYKRDKRDCLYMDNIKEFMDAISNGLRIIIVLSRPYLLSKNCMYELTGVMKHLDYRHRILPVVTDDSIRADEFYVEMCRHWEGKRRELKDTVDKLNEIGQG